MSTGKTLPGEAIVVDVVSRKGGTGKTTVMHALASGMALRGRKVRVIETDDNRRFSRVTVAIDRLGRLKSVDDNRTTYGLYLNPQMAADEAVYKVPIGEQIAKMPKRSGLSEQQIRAIFEQRGWAHPQMYDLIPGSPMLSAIEETAGAIGNTRQERGYNPRTRLAEAVATMRRDFDYIFIDTAPSKGLIPHNAALASDLVLFVLDFDPDSIFDHETSVGFVRDVQATCRQLGRPAPRMLGVVYNKYHPESAYDPVILEAYTKRHYDEDAGRQVDPLVTLPQIGLVRFDRERMLAAMHNRVSMHLIDPTSGIGTDMFTLCETFEQAVAGAGVHR